MSFVTRNYSFIDDTFAGSSIIYSFVFASLSFIRDTKATARTKTTNNKSYDYNNIKVYPINTIVSDFF